MRSLATALLLATFAPIALAQSPILNPGARVRIDAPGVTVTPIASTIVSITPDTITIGDDNLAPLAVPRAAIRTLEVSGIDTWPGIVTGAKIGAIPGAAVGAFLAFGLEDCKWDAVQKVKVSCKHLPVTTELRIFAGATLASAAVGAFIGFCVGSEHWDKVELPGRTTVSLSDGKPALFWSITF